MSCKRRNKTESALRKAEQTFAYIIISNRAKRDLLNKIKNLHEEPQAPKALSEIDIFFHQHKVENKADYYLQLNHYQDMIELWNTIYKKKELFCLPILE